MTIKRESCINPTEGALCAAVSRRETRSSGKWHIEKASMHVTPLGDDTIDRLACGVAEWRRRHHWTHHHALENFGPALVSSRSRVSMPALCSIRRPKSQITSERRLR